MLLPVTTYQYYLLEFFRKHPEQLPEEEEMTADEIVNTLLERDKDLLTKLYEGTYEDFMIKMYAIFRI